MKANKRLILELDWPLFVIVASVLALLTINIPPIVLDALISVNLAISIVLLMAAGSVKDPVLLSTFPTLLLVTTLFRLSLTIASSKQILLTGNAGDIIHTFGAMVAGGNLVVGIVMFLVISLVQFIVIAKGAERVAEVAARFTLDGMPGKQMSIDADLRSGALSKERAQVMRQRIDTESRFFGAMDGAMKFVKGDAIATLIVAFINVSAGAIVGTAIQGLSLGDAMHKYSLLSIGDGMVSQIPSLFASISAGILITRIHKPETGDMGIGSEVWKQLNTNPSVFALSAGLLAILAFVPGFPAVVFALVAAALGTAYWVAKVSHKTKRATMELRPMECFVPDRGGEPPPFLEFESTPGVNDYAPFFITVSPDLARKLDSARFEAAIRNARAALALQVGTPFPGLRLRVIDQLNGDAFAIHLNELPAHQSSIAADRKVRTAGGQNQAVADDEQIIVDAMYSVLVRDASKLVAVPEVLYLVERVADTASALADEVKKVIPLQRLTDVLRRLTEEGVSLRPITQILESLTQWAPKEKDPMMLAEYVRIDLGHYTLHRVAPGSKNLTAILLGGETEEVLRGAVQQTPLGNFLALSPEQRDGIAAKVKEAWNTVSARQTHGTVIFAADMAMRRYFQRLVAGVVPEAPVLSLQEISGHAQIEIGAEV